MSARPQIGDLFATFLSVQNKWAIYQVVQWKAAEKNSCVGDMQDTIAIMALDWWSENLPTASELISLKPLIVNHHLWKDHYDVRYVVNPTPPKNYQMIGNVSCVQNMEINTYGDWPSRHNIVGQYEWLEYPE